MSSFEKLRQVLHSSIKISNLSLSYVVHLFPEFKNLPCIILHKEQRCTENLNNFAKPIDNDQTSQLDITGSPLKYSFNEVDFEDTIILSKQYWSKEEEKYLPLSRTEACNALNTCMEFMTNDSPPIFILCDGKDNKETRLLGTIIKGEWFTTIEICSKGIETFNTIKKSPPMIFEQHLKLSHVDEHDVTISALNTFDLFGTKEEMINWDDYNKSNFEGSLCVEVETSNLSVNQPTRTSKNKLVAQIITGSSTSPLKDLWKQLLLLNQYLTIIEKYNKNSNSHYTQPALEFPHDFTNPFHEEDDTIIKDINLLLNRDYRFRNIDNVDASKIKIVNEENLDNDAKIEQHIQNLPLRYNLDFTDFLFELLIKSSNYFEMTKCIYTVLEDITKNGYLAEINYTNPTRLAKVISNSYQEKMISHIVFGSLPLEYVADMGFEKLCGDYTYILMNVRFGEANHIKKKLGNESCEEFNVDSYRKRLLYMAQIHICLEFMLLIQNNLECSTDDLQPLFLCAYKQYTSDGSPIQNCQDLSQASIYNFSAPLPVVAINSLNKAIPSTWRISLSSQFNFSKLTTIKYYSRLPIFPTTVYPLDDSNEGDEETYHVTSVICSSNKFK